MSETNNKAINEGAEYFVLKINNKNILVDMYDVLDIVESNQKVYINNDPTNVSSLYAVIYKDGTKWVLPIEEETLKRYENFKKNLDKKK